MRIIDKLPAKKLKELYWQRKMSLRKIAEIYQCYQATIWGKFKKYGIKRRTNSEARKLVPKINIPKYPRHNFSGDLKEKAYLIGFRLGDLHAYQARSRTIVVSVASSKRSQIELFEKLFSKYGHIWKGKIRVVKGKKVFPLCCYLNNTFNFLIKKKDLIELWILKNKKYFAAFLAGYSDAEGSFCLCGGDAVFSIHSQDENILHQIREKLIELGILLRPPQIARKKGTKDIRSTISNENIWGLWIHRKDSILKLIDLIDPYLKHADKRRRIKILTNNILERDKKYNRHQGSKWDKLYLKDSLKLCQATVMLAL